MGKWDNLPRRYPKDQRMAAVEEIEELGDRPSLYQAGEFFDILCDQMTEFGFYDKLVAAGFFDDPAELKAFAQLMAYVVLHDGMVQELAEESLLEQANDPNSGIPDEIRKALLEGKSVSVHPLNARNVIKKLRKREDGSDKKPPFLDLPTKPPSGGDLN